MLFKKSYTPFTHDFEVFFLEIKHERRHFHSFLKVVFFKKLEESAHLYAVIFLQKIHFVFDGFPLGFYFICILNDRYKTVPFFKNRDIIETLGFA